MQSVVSKGNLIGCDISMMQFFKAMIARPVSRATIRYLGDHIALALASTVAFTNLVVPKVNCIFQKADHKGRLLIRLISPVRHGINRIKYGDSTALHHVGTEVSVQPNDCE